MKEEAAIVAPAQADTLVMGSTTGIGFTITLAEATSLQPVADVVTNEIK